MSEADLLTVAGPMLANPPLSDAWREALVSRRFPDGRNYLEGWRSEMKYILGETAKQGIWALQRQEAIRIRVAAASWIALYQAVGVEPRIAVWRSYVEGVEEFRLDAEDMWPVILTKAYAFSLLQDAVLKAIGAACYATDASVDRHVGLYLDLRQHAIEQGAILDRGIHDTARDDPELGQAMMDFRNQVIFPENKKLFVFLRDLADRIATGAVDEVAMERKWKDLCN